MLTAQARDRPAVPCLGTVGSGIRASGIGGRVNKPTHLLPGQGARRRRACCWHDEPSRPHIAEAKAALAASTPPRRELWRWRGQMRMLVLGRQRVAGVCMQTPHAARLRSVWPSVCVATSAANRRRATRSSARCANTHARHVHRLTCAYAYMHNASAYPYAHMYSC